MTRERIGQVVFLGAAAAGLVLYALTVPRGLPWNNSTHLALAYLGEITRLPTMPHPVWGRFVQVFGGNVPLACACAAFGAGLLGALVNRYFGWRAAAAAAIVWMFLPSVWNRAVTGERSMVLASMAVAAAWTMNAMGLWMVRKVRTAWRSCGVQELIDLPTGATAHDVNAKRVKINRIASWAILGASVLFAIVSMSFHDYQIGEAASAYARGVVEEAAGRIIVANGLCDDQLGWELKPEAEDEKPNGHRSSDSPKDFDVVFLRNDAAYRGEFIKWVKHKWPLETNLWVSAAVSPLAFVQNAARREPGRFYRMNGASTTKEGWEKRWNEFAPYVKSSDKFVALAKLAFAREGEVLAKRLEQEGDPKGAKHIRERLPQVGAMVRKQAVREVAKEENHKVAPAILSLIEWSNEMSAAMNRGELMSAGRIARAILSNPQWSGFIPANAVMGTVASFEGDYVASAAFFNVAVSTTNAVPTAVLNDYADTLMMLGRLKEAEQMARRAVRESDDSFWLARLTLVEVLSAQYGRHVLVTTVENGEKVERYQKPAGADRAEREIADLIRSINQHAPQDTCEKIRRKYGRMQ